MHGKPGSIGIVILERGIEQFTVRAKVVGF
jgi:hypothetical protein